MDPILPTTVQPQPAPRPTTQTTEDARSVLSSDFETFLQMMTAQARYQDPLDPMDSSEYASQLAQFSMVEQQVKTNDLLDALTGALGNSHLESLSGWIGMEALSIAPVDYDGTPVSIAPNPLAAADELYLVVYNDQGQEVQRTSVPVSTEPYEWTGIKSDGTQLAEGTYTLQFENLAEGEVLLTEAAQSYSRITEARLENGQTVLILEGGAAILANDVSGLREAAAEEAI